MTSPSFLPSNIAGDYLTPALLLPNSGSFLPCSGDTILDEVSAPHYGSILQGIGDYTRQSSHVTRAESERTTYKSILSCGLTVGINAAD